MVLRSWSKNRKAAATSRREKRRCDVAESCRNDVATWQRAAETTSRHCCTTSRHSGSILDGFLAYFEPIIEVFKQKTLGIERRTVENDFLGRF